MTSFPPQRSFNKLYRPIYNFTLTSNCIIFPFKTYLDYFHSSLFDIKYVLNFLLQQPLFFLLEKNHRFFLCKAPNFNIKRMRNFLFVASQ